MNLLHLHACYIHNGGTGYHAQLGAQGHFNTLIVFDALRQETIIISFDSELCENERIDGNG